MNRYTCTFNQLNHVVCKLRKKNILPILDYVNEKYCPQNFSKLKNIILDNPHNLVAIKLSSLGINKISNQEIKTQMIDLCYESIENGNKLLIDAEDYNIQDNINLLTNDLLTTFNRDKVYIYKTYQMYRKDTFDILKQDILKYDSLGIKLVRGAYLNQDKKYNIIHDSKYLVDKDYDKAIDLFLKHSNNNNNNIILATHNDKSVDYAISNMENHLKERVKFAQLLGMNNNLTERLAEENYEVYKYIPFGNFMETIPYLIRRLYENYDISHYLFR